jgi:hypothetical protein
VEEYLKPTMDVIVLPNDIITDSCGGLSCTGTADVIELPALP